MLYSNILLRFIVAYGPIQAQKTFSYATLLMCVITSFIILIALFVFIGAPDLPKTEIWSYMMIHIPLIFKGFAAISLFAIAISTADSRLNARYVMVSHYIVKRLQKKEEFSITGQLKVARWHWWAY